MRPETLRSSQMKMMAKAATNETRMTPITTQAATRSNGEGRKENRSFTASPVWARGRVFYRECAGRQCARKPAQSTGRDSTNLFPHAWPRRPPSDRPLPAERIGCRWLTDCVGERPAPAPADPHARDARLARLEAALFLADEPLTARKLATAAGSGRHGRGPPTRRRGSASCTTPTPPPSRSRRSPAAINCMTRPAYRPWLRRAQRTGGEVRLDAGGPGDAGGRRLPAADHACRRRGDPRRWRAANCSRT